MNGTDGFSLRCPRCFQWSSFSEHPSVREVDEDKLEAIIQQLDNPKFESIHLFGCRQPPGVCPAPVQAVLVRDSSKAHELAERIPSWSNPRVFRPFKQNRKQLWDDFGIIAFNYRPVARQPEIDFEAILDRRLLSKALAGITERTNFPLTVFAAHVIPCAPGARRTHWLPIEGSGPRTHLVPPRFNLFCDICRQATVLPIAEEFAKQDLPTKCPANCAQYCENNSGEAPCRSREWGRCVAFMERLHTLRLCYDSDLKAIADVETAVQHADDDDFEVQPTRTFCWAGLTELAFPIIVHDHLVAVAFTGQFIVEPSRLLPPKQVLELHTGFGAFKDQIENVYDTLQCKRPPTHVSEALTKAFLLRTEALGPIAQAAASDVALIEEIANHRYLGVRNVLESSFRQELLWRARPGTLTTHSNPKPLLVKILGRMIEFWAFKQGALLVATNNGESIDQRAELFPAGAPPHFFGTFPMTSPFQLKRSHSTVFRWERDTGRMPVDPWLKHLFDKLVTWHRGPFAAARSLFIAAIPNGAKTYIFLLIDRDEASRSQLARCRKESISLVCQEAILETCEALVDRMA
jgi:hypothetical protein